MKKGSALHMLAQVLMVIGGLNWGLVGLGSLLETNLNVVNLLLGRWALVENIVYLVVGVAAVVGLLGLFMYCKPSEKGAE